MKILIFGAGRSCVYLVDQIQQYCDAHQAALTIVDQSFDSLPSELLKHSKTKFIHSNLEGGDFISSLIKKQDIIISMLPPAWHLRIAKACLLHHKNLITASYVSKEMLALNAEAKAKGVLLLNEVGVDPGLDHISALHLLDEIKSQGGIIKSFKSHTGGIVAVKTPDNLWDYKITWNPKNVVRAGHEGATFLKNDTKVTVAYAEVFSETQNVVINEDIYDSYPNRDSLKYLKKYELDEVATCYRGTLRHQGFCEAWNVLVQLGMTDDSQILNFKEGSMRQDFLAFFLKKGESQTVKQAFLKDTNITVESSIFKKCSQLGFFENALTLELRQGTAAEILQDILTSSWKITSEDKDMLVMHHEVLFEVNGVSKKATSSLKVVGKDQCYTAMAITVGATLFEAFKLVVDKKTTLKGVCIPTEKSLYKQLYHEVKNHQINFEEVYS